MSMKKSVKVTAWLGLVVLIIGSYLLLSRLMFENTAENTQLISTQTFTTETEYQDNAILKGEISALKQEIADLKAEIQVIKTLVQGSNENSQNNLMADGQKRVPHNSRTKEQTIATDQARELGTKLDEQFRQQTTDKGWSDQTQAVIKRALLNQKVSEENVISLECRLNTCRIELANDENNNSPDISDLPLLIGENLPQLTVDNRNTYDEQANTTVVYLSNQALPVD